MQVLHRGAHRRGAYRLSSATLRARCLTVVLFCSSSEQNELILVGVLDVLYDTVAALLRGQVDKKTMLDNLELVLLTIDEAVRIVLALLQSPSCHPSLTCLS